METSKKASMINELDDIYTSLAIAKKEIHRRWNDKKLKKKVESFLKSDIPDVLTKSPRAVLSRHVSSPNFELLYFLDSSKKIGLKPLCLEYTKDKFVTKNWDKYYLGRMFFFEGTGKKGGSKITSLKVVDFDQYDGKKFSNIRTIWGESMIKFHHSLLCSKISSDNIFDMSCNYKRNGGRASEYYNYILSLFICHGVLFENFLLSDIYDDLTKNILLPSFKKV